MTHTHTHTAAGGVSTQDSVQLSSAEHFQVELWPGPKGALGLSFSGGQGLGEFGVWNSMHTTRLTGKVFINVRAAPLRFWQYDLTVCNSC